MMKKSLLLRSILVILMAAMLLQPVSASADDKSDKDAQGKTELLTETGEAVKCKGGTMVAPVGDPAAKAPKIKARGAVLYSLDMDRPVFGKNEDKRLEPYSTTKLLTSWLALENLDPDSVVTVSKDATQAYENGTTIWLKEGEKMPVRDLIYGAMLESGNDAAYALGEAVAGSEKAFADLMNETVQGWGCEDTHFVNANGWKHKNHYTTAHDMAIITAKCLENKELRKITTTKSYTAAATNLSSARDMTNYFLYVADETDMLTGGKTGTWSDDDCAVVASFSEKGLSEAVVLLGDTDEGRPKDLKTLIDFSHEVTPGFAVPAAGTSVETAWIRHGEKTRLELIADETTYVYPKDNKASEIRTEVKYDKLEAPVSKGDPVGEFLVYADDKLIAEHKLLASEDVAAGWLPSYIYISNKATLNILKALGVLAVLILGIRLIGSRRPPGSRKGRLRKRETVQAEKGTERTRAKAKSTAKERREARKRLREKYRSKH